MGKRRTNNFSNNMSPKKKRKREKIDPSEFMASNITQYSFKRISMICIMQKELSYDKSLLNTLYLDFGDCAQSCQYCGALFWFHERCNESTPLKYNLCSKKGKIKLPILKKNFNNIR